MARFRMAVPTKDCYAVAVGKKEYRAKDGFVETDNADHARQMMKVCSDSIIRSNHGGEGQFCPKCAFHAFSWSSKCPRCGCDLSSV